MADLYRPFVYWGQSKDRIFLKVDLNDITSGPNVDITEDRIEFRAHGIGGRGRNVYGFDLDLYLPINVKRSGYKVTGRSVNIECYKVGVGETWPRLTESNQKFGWIRPDFDHFAFDDSDKSSNDEMEMNEKEMMEKYDKEYKAAEVNVVQDMRTFYLWLYNLFQWIGYMYAFVISGYRYYRYGHDSVAEAYTSIGPILIVCQVASILEIVHPILGWVKTGVIMPIIQVAGRSMILFVLIMPEPRIQDKEPVWWLFMIWSAIELIRYPYYMLAVMGREIAFITWLRYTAWIPLYPAGFILEGIVMLMALPLYEQTNKWSAALPNICNCSFHFPTVLRVYMLLFIPGMYMLMQRMYEQRKKKLPLAPVKPKSQKKA